jgi:hypothetical protein
VGLDSRGSEILREGASRPEVSRGKCACVELAKSFRRQLHQGEGKESTNTKIYRLLTQRDRLSTVQNITILYLGNPPYFIAAKTQSPATSHPLISHSSFRR